MKLRTSRLCLDCEEIHDAQQCPACASESFFYLTRWVPVTVAEEEPPPAAAPADAAVYKRLLVADAVRPKAARLLRRGAVGLAAISLVRWLWRQSSAARDARNTAAGAESRSPMAGGRMG
jgi:hypothetical protein